MKAKHWDFCIHVSGTFDARKCELGHKPRFYMPKSHTDERWGWMRRCEDFKDERVPTSIKTLAYDFPNCWVLEESER